MEATFQKTLQAMILFYIIAIKVIVVASFLL